MPWNHRILRCPDGATFTLYDVYYGEDGTPNGWSAFPSAFAGDSPEEVIKALELALDRAKQPVLQMPKSDTDKLKIWSK